MFFLDSRFLVCLKTTFSINVHANHIVILIVLLMMGKYDRVDVVTALILGLSGLIVGYDTSSIDTSMLDILFEFAIDDKQSFTNSVISYFYVGAMSGGILFCFFYDFLGPRKTLIISDALFISSAAFAFFSIKPSLILVGRFFFGLGLGIATLSCPLIIFETSAIKTRGTLIAFNGLMMGLGSFFSYLFDIFDSGVTTFLTCLTTTLLF